jgi:excisionase family DNA binding protein
VNDPGELIGVREAARRLRVHENTVRNWSDRGILPSQSLPGSSFRRFRADDVGQLRHAVEAGRLERLLQSATVITAGELSQLLAVARMYLDVFLGCDQMPPAQKLLYRDVAGIVSRYAGQEKSA